MIELVPTGLSSHRSDDIVGLSERLAEFAREMEAAGLPWAAANIRNVATTIAAERQLAERFAA